MSELEIVDVAAVDSTAPLISVPDTTCGQCKNYQDINRALNMYYKVCRNCSQPFCPACKTYLNLTLLTRVIRWPFYEEDHPLVAYCRPCVKASLDMESKRQ